MCKVPWRFSGNKDQLVPTPFTDNQVFVTTFEFSQVSIISELLFLFVLDTHFEPYENFDDRQYLSRQPHVVAKNARYGRAIVLEGDTT